MSIIKNTEELNNLLDAVQKLPVKKDEQEKVIDITENGTTVVTPDEGMTLGGVTVNVAVESGGGTEEIENIIDQSGVLDSTDGTVEDKVEQLIDKADDGNLWYEASKNIKTLASTTNPIFVNWAYSKLPRTDFGNVSSMSYAIYHTQLEYIDYYINSAKCTDFTDGLSSNNKLKRIIGIDLSSAKKIFDLFFGNRALETIQEPLNISNVTDARNAFTHCIKLKDMRFVLESIKISIAIPSPVLSIGNVFDLTDTENVGSVQSIINGLATLAEGATAQTLTLSKNLPLTEEQKQAITTAVNNKGWTLAFA